ncbi:MAG: glycosyltransferase, partial [Rhodospirillales bacterium]|nr:glycosyltransferase [Rhodospirillales bacterium]
MQHSITSTISGKKADPQNPAKTAVVVPTTLRASLIQAVESVYEQSLDGTIHILIGVDKPGEATDILHQLKNKLPDRHILTIVDPGYSTSVRHGGLHPARDGGTLRTVLSYHANSPYVAYLDDDNWWDPDHLGSLLSAIENKDWAFGLRWYVHPETRKPICVDEWESVGPGNRQIAMLALDHRLALSPVQRPSFRDKKSRSTFNSPIWRYSSSV